MTDDRYQHMASRELYPAPTCVNRQLFLDIHLKMLEKMYGKRLKGYAAIGYKAKVGSLPEAPTNIIFNKDNFFSVYLQDISMASKRLLIVSPFVTKKRMLQMSDHFYGILKKQVEITIVTRPAQDFKEDRRTSLERIFKAVEETKESING